MFLLWCFEHLYTCKPLLQYNLNYNENAFIYLHLLVKMYAEVPHEFILYILTSQWETHSVMYIVLNKRTLVRLHFATFASAFKIKSCLFYFFIFHYIHMARREIDLYKQTYTCSCLIDLSDSLNGSVENLSVNV